MPTTRADLRATAPSTDGSADAPGQDANDRIGPGSVLGPLPPGSPLPFVGAFESTYLPEHDLDVFETTRHHEWWEGDLALLAASGVRILRYPVRWHRVERWPGRFDWSETDEVFEHLRERGLEPIADLVHHTSYPCWLVGGFADPAFGSAFLRFSEAFATRYPWVRAYTLFNEPFATLFLSGHEGVWPPYRRGVTGLVELLRNVLPAVAEASRRLRTLLPHAQHVWVDSCEHHDAVPGSLSARRHAALCNDRRFFVLDAFLGRHLGRDDDAGVPCGHGSLEGLRVERPFVTAVLDAGGGDLLRLEPGHVDVLGLDYYAHSQWHYREGRAISPTPRPLPLHELIGQYADRYDLPCMLSETNLRGYATDRASWLRYTLEQCELARGRGIDLRGYCWFPFVDSCDWDSLLSRCDGNVDPVGVYWLDQKARRHHSAMAEAYRRAANGAPAADLPAFVFEPPVREQLRGWATQMAHWDWQSPVGRHESGESHVDTRSTGPVPPASVQRLDDAAGAAS